MVLTKLTIVAAVLLLLGLVYVTGTRAPAARSHARPPEPPPIARVEGYRSVPAVTQRQHVARAARRIEHDLHTLIDAYYERYMHPHEFPRYRFTIPAPRSEVVDKYHIHVLIDDPATGCLFPYNTIMQAGAHECAHMLCHVPEAMHGPYFQQTLARLDELAVELGLYEPGTPIPARYQQLCDEEEGMALW